MSKSKTEYLECGFSIEEGDGKEVTIGEVVIPRVRKFRHLGSNHQGERRY